MKAKLLRLLLAVILVATIFIVLPSTVLAVDETVRPEGAGTNEQITNSTSGAGNHWKDVDDVAPDGNLSRVYTGNGDPWKYDTYQTQDGSGTGTPTGVTLYFNCKKDGADVGAVAKGVLYINGTLYEGSEQALTTSYAEYSYAWDDNPDAAPGTEWTWADINNLEIGIELKAAGTTWSYCSQVYLVVAYNLVSAPTTQTDAATNIGATSAQLNGQITATGGENADERGFVWDTVSHGDPGNTAPGASAYSDNWTEAGNFGVASFDHVPTLVADTTYYYRACAHNSAGWSYGGEETFDTLLPLPGAPTSFDVTDSGGADISITWNLGPNATKTMIRVSRDHYPTDIADGEQVYFDTGTSTTDTGYSLDNTTYYFRAWSWNATGYSTDYAEDRIGGDMLVLMLFGFLGLGLTISFFWKHMGMLAYGAAGMWALLGFNAFQLSASTNPTEITDTYMALFWLSVIFAVGCALLPAIMRPKPEPQADDIDEDRELMADIEASERDRERMDKLFNTGRKRRPRRSKMSKFARTGEE